MSVGIYTRYAQADQAYFALRLADFVRDLGERVSIYSDQPPAKLNTVYDNRVVHRDKMRFTAWLRDQSVVVWTGIPRIEQISFAQRLGVTAVVVPMWQDIVPPFKKVLRQADHVVALAAETRELLKTVYKLRNVSFIPFETGLPVNKKDRPVDARCIRVLLPWFDRNARCTQAEFLSGLEYVVTRMPELHLTVAISSSKFSPAIAKFFRGLGRRTGRVTVRRNISINDRPALFTAHDLTMFPAECDNFGFCNLLSLTCGTPVLTFEVSPQTDFVYPDVNGVVVKTQVDYDEHGVPHAKPDYDKYLKYLQTLIAEPWHINNMNKKINYNLNSRRRAFELGWQAVLRLV